MPRTDSTNLKELFDRSPKQTYRLGASIVSSAKLADDPTVVHLLSVAISCLIRPRGYKTFSTNTQLSMKFILLVNVKMPTIVSESFKAI